MAETYGDSKSYNKLGVIANFSWEIIEQDAGQNTTTIKWHIDMTKGSSGTYPDNTWKYEIKTQDSTESGTIISGGVTTVIEPKIFSQTIMSVDISKPYSYDEEVIIPHKEDNTRILYFRVRIYNTEGSGTSGSVVNTYYEYTLPTLPFVARIASAPNFNDEENPTITYTTSNPENYTSIEACISLTGGEDDVSYRAIPKGDNSYTFYLTDAERATLRRAFENQEMTRTVRFYVKTVMDGNTYWSFLDRTMTLINYLPTISPTITDTNALTVSLTGDNTKFIKFFSNATFTTGVTAKKEATIAEQTVVCGSKKVEDASSGTILGMDSNIFYCKATDSRGFVVSKYTVLNTIAYTKPTCNIRSLSLSSDGNLTFTIHGNYFNSSFGAKNNSLEFECGYRKDGGDITWKPFTATPDIENNTYTLTHTLSGFDYKSQYTVMFNIIDELSNAQSPSRVVGSISVFDWGKTDFRHNTDVYHTFGTTVHTENVAGTNIEVLNPCDDNNNLVIGRGNYDENAGGTSIYGKTIDLVGSLNINNRAYGLNNVLWSGASHMNGEQSITLSEAISAQPSGIVLVFSGYDNDTAQALDSSINTFFVSKKQVELFTNVGMTFLLGINAGFSVMGAKYLYFTDTTISGHDGNTSTGTNSGITFANNQYALRYVIGV